MRQAADGHAHMALYGGPRRHFASGDLWRGPAWSEQEDCVAGLPGTGALGARQSWRSAHREAVPISMSWAGLATYASAFQCVLHRLSSLSRIPLSTPSWRCRISSEQLRHSYAIAATSVLVMRSRLPTSSTRGKCGLKRTVTGPSPSRPSAGTSEQWSEPPASSPTRRRGPRKALCRHPAQNTTHDGGDRGPVDHRPKFGHNFQISLSSSIVRSQTHCSLNKLENTPASRWEACGKPQLPSVFSLTLTQPRSKVLSAPSTVSALSGHHRQNSQTSCHSGCGARTSGKGKA
jgi:hypothetical protein